MRLFYDSRRRSQDIDLDYVGAEFWRVEDKVDETLVSRAFRDLLGLAGVEMADLTKPKQTGTPRDGSSRSSGAGPDSTPRSSSRPGTRPIRSTPLRLRGRTSGGPPVSASSRPTTTCGRLRSGRRSRPSPSARRPSRATSSISTSCSPGTRRRSRPVMSTGHWWPRPSTRRLRSRSRRSPTSLSTTLKRSSSRSTTGQRCGTRW